MTDTKLLKLVRPLPLRRLFETCDDSKTIGDICRFIGGQQVEMDGAAKILAKFIMTPSQEELEFRKRDAERHARYVARKRAEDAEGWKAHEREAARRKRARHAGKV